MQSFWSFLKKYWAVLVLASLAVGVFLSGFKPGTWLLGWDNLVPEFNFGLNINRSIFSAWQEYQGLGLAAGMAHGASLSREVLLWALSGILPVSFVRSFWTMAMLVLGPIGTYFLAQYFFTKGDEKPNSVASFIAGSFYLFNLGTLQYFYPPFETFSSFYGFFPWLLLVSLAFLQHGGKSRAWRVFWVSLVAGSAFQVQTLFVVYLLVMGVFLLELLVRGSWAEKKRVVIWVVLQLLVNFYWLFPVGYFTLTQSQTNVQAQQNVLSTPELKVMNQNYGDWQHITALQGYWFDYLDKDAQFKAQYLLAGWKDYLADGKWLWVERSLFGVGVLGLLWLAGTRKKDTLAGSLVGLGVLVPLILTAGHGSLGKIYVFAEQYIPLFSQIFRTTFTKWSMVMVLLIALGLGFVYLKISAKLFVWLRAFFLVGVMVAMVGVVGPFFQGQLIYAPMKVALPPAYTQLFEFFQQQPKQARIALLPAQSIWGWEFYQWGYRGSGFLWYGIEQPILSRTFDIYSGYDENFYHQFSTAVQAGSPVEVAGVLEKYQVTYVLVDESVFLSNSTNTASMPATTANEEEVKLLQAGGFQPVWKKDFLTVYAQPAQVSGFLQPVNTPVQFLQLPALFQAKKIAPEIAEAHVTDQADDAQSKIFPFANLTANRVKNFAYQSSSLQLISDLKNQSAGNYMVAFPALKPGDSLVVPLTLLLTESDLKLEFAPAGEFEVGSEKLPFYKLADQDIPLVQHQVERVLLTINGRTFIVSKTQPLKQVITLKAGSPINITLSEIYSQDQLPGFFKSAPQKDLTLDSHIWDEFFSPKEVPLTLAKSAQFKLNLATEAISVLPELSNNTLPGTCDALKRGSVKKLVTAKSLTYEAVNAGVACASVELKGISQDSSYFLHLKGQNILGRPAKVSLSGLKDNYFYLEQLLDSGAFDEGFVLLPLGEKLDRYFLNLEIKSFGQDMARSQFDLLDLAELPVNSHILSAISLVPVDYQPSQSAATLSGGQKWSTWFYSSQVNITTPSGFVALQQGFDKGWVMVAFSAAGRSWPTHFLLNDWANGWLIPQGEYTVWVFYWPQLGVFGGFCILVLMAGWFFQQWLSKRLLKDKSSF